MKLNLEHKLLKFIGYSIILINPLYFLLNLIFFNIFKVMKNFVIKSAKHILIKNEVL